MKLRNIIAAGLMASMALVACNKENTTAVVEGPMKSVSISLANVLPASRSINSTPIEGVEGGTAEKVGISNFQVFFTDGNRLYLGKDVNGEDYLETFYEADAEGNLLTTTEIFHYLPASVNKVIVIGNLEEKINVINNETLINVLDGPLAIADEQSDKLADDMLTLYGEGSLTKATGDEAHTNFYTATVKVAPRISRLEISQFVYEQIDENTPRNYETLTIAAVALNNYYAASTIANLGVNDTDHYVEIEEANAFEFLDRTAGEGEEWALDQNLGISLAAETYTGGADKQIAYHFFPGLMPQLVVKVIANEGTDSETPLYLATSSLTGVKEATTDVGYVYRVNFTFNDDSFGQPTKCVQVIVETVEWAIVAVTPNF